LVSQQKQFKKMPDFRVTADHLGREVKHPVRPQRIVSLVPSITELIWDLGLQDEIVGITRFCVNPREMFKSKERVGGTKEIKMERLHRLKPDLIVANKEENTKEMVTELEKDYPVFVTEVSDFKSALKMIDDVADVCGKKEGGQRMSCELNKQYRAFLEEQKRPEKRPKVAYMIWKKPWMTVGGDTFVSEMLEIAGMENIFKKRDRYPMVTLEEIQSVSPDFVLLSSEPYPFKEKHLDEVGSAVADAKIELVDGELFSWYGSRLLRSFDYFRNLKKRLTF